MEGSGAPRGRSGPSRACAGPREASGSEGLANYYYYYYYYYHYHYHCHYHYHYHNHYHWYCYYDCYD